MCKLTQSLHVVDTDGTSVVGISAGVELLAVKLENRTSAGRPYIYIIYIYMYVIIYLSESSHRSDR